MPMNDSSELDLAQDTHQHWTRNQDRDIAPCVLQYIVFPPHTTTVRDGYVTFWDLWVHMFGKLRSHLGLSMVCSHSPTLRVVESGLWRIMWRCSHCSEKEQCKFPLGSGTHFIYQSRCQSRAVWMNQNAVFTLPDTETDKHWFVQNKGSPRVWCHQYLD